MSMLGPRSSGESYSKEQLLVTTMQQVAVHVSEVRVYSLK